MHNLMHFRKLRFDCQFTYGTMFRMGKYKSNESMVFSVTMFTKCPTDWQLKFSKVEFLDVCTIYVIRQVVLIIIWHGMHSHSVYYSDGTYVSSNVLKDQNFSLRVSILNNTKIHKKKESGKPRCFMPGQKKILPTNESGFPEPSYNET